MAFAGKRLMDVIAAAALLIGLLPLLVLIAVLVKRSSPGPVLYQQERVGHKGKLFTLYKFRTMVIGADRENPSTGIGDPRITAVGSWLRRFSLDELPQLGNVLIGDMSLVGPRPAPLEVAAYFTGSDRERLAMRPGLTGWTQINGRNALSWSERIALDRWYVENWSLRLDLLILLRTVRVVISGDGLYGPGGWNRGYE